MDSANHQVLSPPHRPRRGNEERGAGLWAVSATVEALESASCVPPAVSPSGGGGAAPGPSPEPCAPTLRRGVSLHWPK